MKMQTWQRWWLAAWLGAICCCAAKEPSLKVGDQAPKFLPGKWVQGEPVKELDRNKVYIIDFWSSWTATSQTAIPHLDTLQTKFKDQGLVVIGQSVCEENQAMVEPFIKKMAKVMTYRVALDNVTEKSKGTMMDTWLDAAGEEGLPTSFIVDKQGRLAWIGHPVKIKSAQIQQLLEGAYDLKQAAEDYSMLRRNEAELLDIWKKTKSCFTLRHWDHIGKNVDRMEKLVPASERTAFDVIRFRMLMGTREYKEAFKLAEKLSDACQEEALVQNQLAWAMLISGVCEGADLDLAEKIAERANTSARSMDAAILDTLARARFMKGKKKEAIELQEQAVKMADEFQNSSTEQSLKQTLESYKEGKLPKAE